MLTGQILNSQASLNNYIELGTLNFVPGEQFILVTKLINPQLNIRFVVEDTNATVKFIFNKANNETEEVTGIFLTNDRSIVSATITSAISDVILTGNFIMEIDVKGDASEILKVFVQNGLTKQLGAC